MKKRWISRWGGAATILVTCAFAVVGLATPTSRSPGLPAGPDGVVCGPPGPVDDILRALRIVTGFLDLSAEQSEQVKEILRTTADEVRGLRESLRELECALGEELSSDNPSVETVGQLVINIHEIRGSIAEVQQGALEAMGDLLTEGQLAKVEAVRKAARLEPVVHAFRILDLLPPPDPPVAGETDPAQN